MRFIIDVDKFRTAFLSATKLIDAAPNIRGFKDVKVVADADKQTITLAATNLDDYIRIVIYDVDVAESGSVLLLAKQTVQILAGAGTGVFNIEVCTEGNLVKVVAGTAVYKLPTRAVDDYLDHAFPDLDEVVPYRISIPSFLDAVKTVAFAVDKQRQTRYAIEGVLFDPRPLDGKFHIVATDGRRLSATSINVDKSEVEPESLILAAKTAKMVQQIVLANSDSEEPILYFVNDRKGYFVVGNTYICCRPLEGRFPNWESILLNKSEMTLYTVSAAELLGAIKQSEVCTNFDNPGATFVFKNDTLTLKVEDKQLGSSNVEIPLQSVSAGTEHQVKLDISLLKDYVASCNKVEAIDFYVVDGKTAVQLYTPELAESVSNFVCMPMVN